MLPKTALKRSLSKHGISGILVTAPANVRYLTDFSGSSGFAVITSKHSIFVTDFRYEEQASEEVKGYRIIVENEERSKVISNICSKYSINRLGFEANDIRYGFYKRLIKSRVRLKPLTDTVESLRVVKSADETSNIRTAVRRAEKAFRRLLPYIKKGAAEKALAVRLEGYLRDEGSERLPFPAIVASGPMSALPHARPSGRRLRAGDLVVFDWGAECNSYFSDMARTVLIKGRNIERQKYIYSVVHEAHKRAVRSVRSDVKGSAIDSAARDYIKEQELDDYFGHATGHGVGLEVHEKPVVSWRSKDTVKNGMVFTVEPGIYIPDFGGVRIEDMVVVKKGGAEVLNKLPKTLKIIER